MEILGFLFDLVRVWAPFVAIVSVVAIIGYILMGGNKSEG